MNFKLKALVAAAVMSVAATSASAATNGTGANGSSMIFSAWDSVALTSYSFDLSSYLGTFLGADTVFGSFLNNTTVGSLNNKTNNAANTLTASGTVFAGTAADIKLMDFNLSGSSVLWNLAGSDATARMRLLVSETGSLAGLTNSQVKTVATGVGSYLGLGAADSTVNGTIGVETSPYYADSMTWGDTMGGTLSNTSNVLGGVSNMVAAWQQSTTLAGGNAGYANMTNALGQAFTATTYTVGADTFLRIAAVPEADTSGMMLAGLGLMGFIARRRNRKQA